jgi:hypothetical protein
MTYNYSKTTNCGSKGWEQIGQILGLERKKTKGMFNEASQGKIKWRRNSKIWWFTPIIPATPEAEAGGSRI